MLKFYYTGHVYLINTHTELNQNLIKRPEAMIQK